jgi:hypothetical protein
MPPTPAPAVIQSVDDFLRELGAIGFVGARQRHVRVWFRDQPESGLPLQPGVYRPTFPAANEAERLLTEQHLAQDFRVESAGLLTGRERDDELYFLQQHYRFPTRLLDWTHNPLASLFFAVGKPNFDGEIFLMDAYQMDTSGFTNFGAPTSRHPVFKKALDEIMDWHKGAGFPDFIIPIRPDHFDRRIAYQQSCFTFHVPKKSVLTTSENRTLRSFVIPAAAKPAIKTQLSLLGVDEFRIYGDLESLAKRLKTAHGIP